MPSLKTIRKRIVSVKNTRKITRAMKLVAAAKLRRAQDTMIAARPYTQALTAVVAELSGVAGKDAHPLFEEREAKRIAIVVVTADRGLAGAFNTNVHRATSQLFAAHPEWTEVRILPVGKKAVEYWRRRKTPFTEKTYPGLFNNLTYAEAREIATFLAQEFLEERIDAAYVVVNEFRSILSQVVRTARLLPLVTEAAAKEGEEKNAKDSTPDYLFEPNAAAILAWLLPRYLEFTVYRALAESAAAEMGARMTAMDSASKNAGEIIDKLTLTYNRARQARITKELIEIVSGAAALE